MSLTIQQKSNHSGFPKPGELIEITGTHLLETSDRTLLNTLMKRVLDSGRVMETEPEWEIPFAELREGYSKHESNDRLRASLKRLGSVRVTVHYATAKGEARTLETPLLAFIDTGDDDEGANATLQYSIPRPLRSVLLRSNRWGRVRCEVAYAMRCKYAIALYEMICMRIERDSCIESFEIGRFRDFLGVPPGSYTDGANFWAKVVEPALLEVNGLSDFGVAIEPRRKHARAPVHGVTVSWWRKEGDAFRAAIQERQRSKIGRKARLRGTVEAIEGLAAPPVF